MESGYSSINNRKILKNTVVLYGRMLLTMGISLYTSRVVLNVLGVDDYGIYGLVGGIVVLFSFLNGTMSGATSRYLTIELARSDVSHLRRTFSTALLLHIGIALIVFVLAETIGLWLLLEKLNISEGRMSAAIWVYQFSVVSSVISITQVPYNASLIAHEKMDVFAIIEVVNSILKLVVALLLSFAMCDKLILYSGLILSISFVIAMSYRIYCNRHYNECRGKLLWDKNVGKSMLGFSGWNLYSNMCFTGRQQGTNMLLNIFGSTAVNAAAGLATSVQYMVEQVATNLVMASRPQIIKQYATDNFSGMVKLLKQTAILANMLYLVIAVPFIAEIHYVLKLWLIQVPPYTVEFCVLMTIASFISLNNNILYIGIQAVGRMRFYSFVAGTASLLVIPLLWICFNHKADFSYAFGLPIISNFLIYVVCIYSLHNYVHELRPWRYFFSTMLSHILIILPVFVIISFLHYMLKESFNRLVITIFTSSICIVILSYYVLLTKGARMEIMNKLKTNIFKI